MPSDDLAGSLLERDDGPVARQHTAQLRVIEHQRVRLVPQQAGAPSGVGRGDHIRGDVDDVGPRSGGVRQGVRDLVPGEHVIGGYVEDVADGAGVAEQGDEPRREVLVVRQRPQRGAVAVHDDRLALAHPGQHRPATIERHQGLVIGVRGPHDRGRETVVTVGGAQQFLARDLVAGVAQERVAQRGGLQDRHAGRRRLIRRGGADEHVLPGPAAEEVDVGLDVLGCERHPVHHRVELTAAEDLPDGPRIADVAAQHGHAGRQRPVEAEAAVEHAELDSRFGGQPRTGRTDHTAAADEEYPHPPNLKANAVRLAVAAGVAGLLGR